MGKTNWKEGPCSYFKVLGIHVPDIEIFVISNSAIYIQSRSSAPMSWFACLTGYILNWPILVARTSCKHAVHRENNIHNGACFVETWLAPVKNKSIFIDDGTDIF